MLRPSATLGPRGAALARSAPSRVTRVAPQRECPEARQYGRGDERVERGIADAGAPEVEFLEAGEVRRRSERDTARVRELVRDTGFDPDAIAQLETAQRAEVGALADLDHASIGEPTALEGEHPHRCERTGRRKNFQPGVADPRAAERQDA